MNQDNDVEKLFSWLQTPDIRYREFAGAREITDAVSIVRVRADTPENEAPAAHNTKLDEEYPPNQYPDQSQTRIEIAAREPAASALPSVVHHEPAAEASPPPSTDADPNEEAPRSLHSVFNRLSGGRASDRDPRERTSRIPGLRPTDGRPR